MGTKPKNSPKTPKTEGEKTRKPRKEKTPAQLAAATLAKGKDALAALESRITKHEEVITVLSADRNKLREELAAARAALLSEE